MGHTFAFKRIGLWQAKHVRVFGASATAEFFWKVRIWMLVTIAPILVLGPPTLRANVHIWDCSVTARASSRRAGVIRLSRWGLSD